MLVGALWIVLAIVLSWNVWLALRCGYVFGRWGKIDRSVAPKRFRVTFGISLFGAPLLLVGGLLLMLDMV
ncbi:hypothetical protein SPHINGOAX6_70742 [Sphingomonas sp. AX6]|nr:hypothetical protein SPHINGOAX6_70742 [Sphingomonas sp. AX6]